MMKVNIRLSLLFLFFLMGCNSRNYYKISVKNETDIKYTDYIIPIKLSELSEENGNELLAFINGKEVPFQLIDKNGNGNADLFTVLLNINPKEEKEVVIKKGRSTKKIPKRVHAEVSEKKDYNLIDGVYTGGHFESVKSSTTPPGHIDHDYYYKMEGPAWESDKVGYRIYLDWRNSVDIFGKKVNDIVLPKVGYKKDARGNDTYHKMSNWGMDIFKVGKSLGIGTFAAFIDGKVEKVSKTDSTICTIYNDGPIFASLGIKYFGWNFGYEKTELNSTIEISAGSRLTHYILNINSSHKEFCSGLEKHVDTEWIEFEKKNGSDWNYIAEWGNQSLSGENDKLGIALFYKNSQFVKLTEDKLSRIVVLTPIDNKIDYYFAACWDKEPEGIKTKEEFVNYLDIVINMLNNPLIGEKISNN